MCVCTFLREKAAAMGPTEQAMVDRAWIEWLLEEHPCTCGDAEGAGIPSSATGYAVEELAPMFDAARSTIRTWCAHGVFGPPQTLKPNGRDWRVSRERVDELLKKLAEGYRITAKGLVAPGHAAGKSRTKNSGSRKGARGTKKSGDSGLAAGRDPRPKAKRRRQRSRDRKHGGWRELVHS